MENLMLMEMISGRNELQRGEESSNRLTGDRVIGSSSIFTGTEWDVTEIYSQLCQKKQWDTRKRKFVFVLALQAVSCASSCLLYFLVWKRWRLGVGLITMVRCYCHVYYCGNWLIQITDPLKLSLFIFLFRVHGREIIEVNLYPLDPSQHRHAGSQNSSHTHTHTIT